MSYVRRLWESFPVLIGFNTVFRLSVSNGYSEDGPQRIVGMIEGGNVAARKCPFVGKGAQSAPPTFINYLFLKNQKGMICLSLFSSK